MTGSRDGESYVIRDERFILEFFEAHKEDDPEALTAAVLAESRFWGEDLTAYAGLAEKVAGDLRMIEEEGAYALMRRCTLRRMTLVNWQKEDK